MEKNILDLAVLLIGIIAIIGVMNNVDDGTGNKTRTVTTDFGLRYI